MPQPTKYSHEIGFLCTFTVAKMFVFFHIACCFITCLTKPFLKRVKIVIMVNNLMYCCWECIHSRGNTSDECLPTTRQRQWAVDGIPKLQLASTIHFNSTANCSQWLRAPNWRCGFWVSAPFIGSKLGHNLQTSFNNNANSLVQDPSNLFHQLNRRMPLGLESGSRWGGGLGGGGEKGGGVNSSSHSLA